MPIKSYYSASVPEFLNDSPERILGILTAEHHHALEEPQRWAWLQEISILKNSIPSESGGRLFLEFYIPRMGKRADAAFVNEGMVFLIEFKVGAHEHHSAALDQVEDYALDLKNFHEGSHDVPIVPILVSSNATSHKSAEIKLADDLVAVPIETNAESLGSLLQAIFAQQSFPYLDVADWMAKGYRPTPTIVEAAQVLYRTHRVRDISRSDAGAKNLHETTQAVVGIIDHARQKRKKAICFVTGVPGSGKTLAGLNIATRRSDEHRDEHAVFLSGNGPLVTVLREALARDKVRREHISKKVAERQVHSFIQNIHHFRDQYVGNEEIPTEKVVVFDEAQRAWTREQAAYFMQRKRGQPNFDMSEPQFLISVMDRHPDWCTVICLVGGGQEINTGEASISEWINALQTSFPEWEVNISPRIALSEYDSGTELAAFLTSPRVRPEEHLHLSVSMRSYRAEKLSDFVGQIIEGDATGAERSYTSIRAAYPIYVTRHLPTAKTWLRRRARGTERFGLIASSGAQRLRPEGIHIKTKVDPRNWFLNNRRDVRSSFYLEEVASEFDVQGLELDWAGVCWDGDFHFDGSWKFQAFKGTKWQAINDTSRRIYLKNAYRVILTRARQGMVIFVPKGDDVDGTRPPSIYDGTFNFLRSCGIRALE